MVLLIGAVIAIVMALLILWDKLVGTALVGVAAGATWLVAQSGGRWWYWPVVVIAVLSFILAFVVAVLIS